VKSIRIAFVASSFHVGGAENVMFDLITRLPRTRFDCRLFFLKEAGLVGEELYQKGIPAEAFLIGDGLDPAAPLRVTWRLRSFQPHILFCIDHRNAIVLGSVAARLAGIPRIVIASHSTGRFGKTRNFGLVERVFVQRADRFVALSRAHAEYSRDVEGIDERRIAVIENGIDAARYASASETGLAEIRRELGLTAENDIVLMVAVLRPEKAHEALLKAAKRLIASHPSLKFLIAGDGPRRAELERMTRDLQLEKNVVFLGLRRDVAELLHLADVLVLPSHPVVETLPLAVLEAMAAGTPVVASAVGSLPEVIEDGVNGRLIPPADDAALASALGELLTDRALARRLAGNARRLVEERFSVDKMVKKYITMFEELAFEHQRIST
jgi:glycosyltransferase involved in cell wall biosynthesis